VRLTLLGKPDCHLCDDARDVVADVIARLGAEDAVQVDELSILDDPDLNARYWDEIPVVMIDGAVHTIWKVDPERLRAALTGALTD
jgi:hypothetical protein